MKVIFAGTPEFAARALDALLSSHHQVRLVLTQPDRPAGRGLKPATSPVKQLALDHQVRVLQPASLKDAGSLAELAAVDADVVVVAAYGLILPQQALVAARLGAINIHASLLPRWRGAAPIQRAILAGDRETGICIMQMDAGLDTGPVLLRRAIAIGERENAQGLHDRLATLGAALLLETLDGLERNTLVAVAQTDQEATYAAKIDKAEAAIDWARSAPYIDRQIRSFNPHPGAFSRLRGVEIKLWHGVPAEGSGSQGEVLLCSAEGIVVGCGNGVIRLTRLQRSGGKQLDASSFLRGFPIAPGERFSA